MAWWAGIYQLAPEVAGKLVGSFKEVRARSNEAKRIKHELTERELEVLRLIATGATNREIAEQIFVSEGTVKNHVSNIISRLGLRDRTQAAIYTIENNII